MLGRFSLWTFISNEQSAHYNWCERRCDYVMTKTDNWRWKIASGSMSSLRVNSWQIPTCSGTHNTIHSPCCSSGGPSKSKLLRVCVSLASVTHSLQPLQHPSLAGDRCSKHVPKFRSFSNLSPLLLTLWFVSVRSTRFLWCILLHNPNKGSWNYSDFLSLGVFVFTFISSVPWELTGGPCIYLPADWLDFLWQVLYIRVGRGLVVCWWSCLLHCFWSGVCCLGWGSARPNLLGTHF